MRRLLTTGASVALATAVLAACSTTPPSLAGGVPITPRAEPSELMPSPGLCDPNQVRLSSGDWGPAAGTTFVILHVEFAPGSSCLIPGEPAVDLVDASGQVIASGPSRDPASFLPSEPADLRLAWASWCAAP